MSNYSYVAVDPQGSIARGTLNVADQREALRRIKEMGLFPTKVLETREKKRRSDPPTRTKTRRANLTIQIPGLSGRVRPATLTVFTRQLATLVEAGMPLLRSLRILHEQEERPAMKRVLEDLASSIENGASLGEAVAAHPRVFNALYVNLVKAGELSGALNTTLARLAEYMEKSRRIKGKVTAALFYPCAVLFVAATVITLLMTYVVPKIRAVVEGLNSGPMPAFSQYVFNISGYMTRHLPSILLALVLLIFTLSALLRIPAARNSCDRLKLRLPVFGPILRKAGISRFSRTLGTLVSSGVPILQALSIVRDTAGNQLIERLISRVHENVKQGEPIAPTLKSSSIFPAMVAGMVDVGEQTGALPEMLMKIADTYDEDVDNSVSAMTSLLEPVMIVLLAVVVGSIVIAVFLPIIPGGPGSPGPGADAE